MRNVCLLGASGSIGTQSLDIIMQNPDRFCLKAVSVGRNIKRLDEILRDFPSIEHAYAISEDDIASLRGLFPKVRFLSGEEGLKEMAELDCCDMVVNALVGFAGVAPTLSSLGSGKILCLANKESLVVAGGLVNGLLEAGEGRLYPIDSEHVAIAKLLRYAGKDNVDKVLITASGGPFRNLSREQLKGITPERALDHPTWHMGKKITIDSATMMNKGFEVIEACYLFDLSPDDIEIVINPESHVHSLVKLKDGSYLADVSSPDMHSPIAYALFESNYPFDPMKKDSLDGYAPYHLLPFNPDRFPSVGLSLSCYRRGGNMGAALNGANEAAVYAFLDRQLPFLQIEEAVSYACSRVDYVKDVDYEALKLTDQKAREDVRRFVSANEKR